VNKAIKPLFKKYLNFIRAVISNKFFPFLTATIICACYYLGWDLVAMAYIALAFIFCLLLLSDATPAIGVLLFLNCFVSKKNSPSPNTGASSFYYSPAVISFIVLLALLCVVALIYKVVKRVRVGAFKVTPTFFGVIALSVALVLNGLFSKAYSPSNLLFGATLGAIYSGFFTFVCACVKPCKQNYIKIAYAFLALSLLLVLQLIILYFTTPQILKNGAINKELIVFGWGIWNTMGMLLSCSLPFVLYLAGNQKYGFIFSAFSAVVALCVFLTSSRQSILATAIIYPIGFIYLIAKGRHQFANLAVCVALVISGLLTVAVFKEQVIKIIDEMLQSLTNSEGVFTGNGRTELLQQAYNSFINSPIFGGGFFAEVKSVPNFDGLDFVPEMYHNSVMQMLGACGGVGFFAYMAHRAQTAIIFLRNPTYDRSFVALSLTALVITGLFDNHLFYIFPSIFYASLVALLAQSEDLRGE